MIYSLIMHGKPSKRAISIFAILTAGILLLLFFDFGKTHSLLIDSFLAFGHIPLFCLVASMVLWLLNQENRPSKDPTYYIAAFAISLVLAVISELLQMHTPERFFELGDILRDTAGAAIFLMLAYRRGKGLSRKTRITLIYAPLALLAAASIPVLASAFDVLRAKIEFPRIASFETSLEMDRWKIKGVNARVPMHATQGKCSLWIDLAPGVYLSASLSYPPRDWKGYDSLSFDAFLEGGKPLPITVRINDLTHNEEYEDRYNRTFTLKPGQNQMTISLSEVEHAPKGRLMDMKHISILCIFSYRIKEPRTIYFDNFRLKNPG